MEEIEETQRIIAKATGIVRRVDDLSRIVIPEGIHRPSAYVKETPLIKSK